MLLSGPSSKVGDSKLQGEDKVSYAMLHLCELCNVRIHVWFKGLRAKFP